MTVGRLSRGESGQVLPLFACGLAIAALGFAALVIDVGHGYLVQRRLQASVDAAALAGAAQLPSASAALTAAASYGPTGDDNEVEGASDPTLATGCLATDATCSDSAPDLMSVTASATVATTFARLLGIDSFTVHATAAAARTASVKPFDIAVVVDRTGSMSGQMTNLRAGIDAFLGDLDSSADRVALLVLPPVPAGSGACSTYNASVVQNDWYPLGSEDDYVVDHLTSNFAQLESDIGCIQPGGPTSYEQALVAAETELSENGRPGVPKVIVFETDGAANTVPDSDYTQPDSFTDGGQLVTGTPASTQAAAEIAQPCGSAVSYVASLSGTTTVYTVGYELSSDNTCYQAPHLGGSQPVLYKQVKETDTNAGPALAAMAADTGGQYYPQEDGSELDTTFAEVASQFSAPTLVADST